MAATESVVSVAPYKLAPGDELNITVFGEDDISGEYVIDSAGNVVFPLVGVVEARGRTTSEFKDALAQALSNGFLINPSIIVEVGNPRPVYILGEVRQPGEYEYAEEMTVLKVVAKAGGFTYRANKSRVYVLHYGEDEENKYDLTPSTAVSPGDTIRIGERYF